MSTYRGFARPNFSWQSYNVHRPTYPHSLFEIILKYVHSHAKSSLSATHDIGAGSALPSSVLAHYFPRLLVSDPVSSNIQAARETLSSASFLQSLKDAETQCDIQIEQQPGEDQSWIPSTSLDLVTSFEALHWMDSEVVVREAWRTLKVGGVVAFIYYGTKPYIQSLVSNEQDRDASKELRLDKANDLLDFIVSSRLKSQNADDTEGKNLRSYRACTTGLDFVAFPKGQWYNVERWEINVGEAGASFGAWRHSEGLPSGVAEGEKKICVENVDDWSRVVGREWVHGYFASLQLGLENLDEGDEASVALAELDRLLGKRQVRVVWPVAMVFAAKAT